MKIDEKRLERAKETFERLKKKKIGEINEAQALVCSHLKCFIIAGDDDMQDRALDMLLLQLDMKPDMIIKTIKEIELSEEFVAHTLMIVRHCKLIEQAEQNVFLN